MNQTRLEFVRGFMAFEFLMHRAGILIIAFYARLLAAGDPITLESARALYDSDQLDRAQQAFETLAATGSADSEIQFHLGEIALRRNATESAIDHFKKAIAAAPTNSRYHHRLGDAYGRAAQEASVFSALGLAKKCLRSFQRAVELDPDNLDARFSLFTFYRGAPAIIGGGAARAAAEAAAIKARDPDRGRIAFAALHVSQKKFDAARAELAELRPISLANIASDRVFLSDVEWKIAQVGWGAPARNHAWFDEKSHPGVVLIVHGRLYSKGLYAHSPSRYTFALDGKWKHFTGTLGLRDGAHEQGSAVFIVRGDGRELYRSATLRVNASARVKLDVTGINELELLTEPGEAHNHNSWAVWAEPLVQR
jgi:tetratricopeptide (TPR) repeat protein